MLLASHFSIRSARPSGRLSVAQQKTLNLHKAELAQKSNHNLFIKQQGKTVPPFYHLPRPHYANREPSTALQQRP